ncbi:hypothetical protein P8452_03613 [Trifolium repens]|nr:hypothetical protein P8452_03613 [Trifolium repens]
MIVNNKSPKYIFFNFSSSMYAILHRVKLLGVGKAKFLHKNWFQISIVLEVERVQVETFLNDMLQLQRGMVLGLTFHI